MHNSNRDFYTTAVWKNSQIDTQVFTEGFGLITWSLLVSGVQEAFSGFIFACRYVCFKSSFETNASLNLLISVWDLGFPTLFWVTRSPNREESRSVCESVETLLELEGELNRNGGSAELDGTERAAGCL